MSHRKQPRGILITPVQSFSPRKRWQFTSAPAYRDTDDTGFRGRQAKQQRNVWSNWLDGIRRAQGKARRVQKYVTQNESLLGRMAHGTEGSFSPHPSIRNSAFKTQIKLCYPRRVSSRNYLKWLVLGFRWELCREEGGSCDKPTQVRFWPCTQTAPHRQLNLQEHSCGPAVGGKPRHLTSLPSSLLSSFSHNYYWGWEHYWQ